MWIPIIIPFGLRGKSKIIDNKTRVCINCKNKGVQLVKNDEWFHLFFIPCFKVKNGVAYLHCPTCGCTVPYYEKESTPSFNNPEDVHFVPDGKGQYDTPKTNIPPGYVQQQYQPPGYTENINNNQGPIELTKEQLEQYYQQQQLQQQIYQQQQYEYNQYHQNEDFKSNFPPLSQQNVNQNPNLEKETDKKEKKHHFFSRHKKEKEET